MTRQIELTSRHCAQVGILLEQRTIRFLALEAHEVIVFAHVDVELFEALHAEDLFDLWLEADLSSSPALCLPLLEGARLSQDRLPLEDLLEGGTGAFPGVAFVALGEGGAKGA